jgi:hypothetical protein
MVVHMLNRHEQGERYPSIPKFKQPPAEIATEHYGKISLAEITDWLLNQSVADPL